MGALEDTLAPAQMVPGLRASLGTRVGLARGAGAGNNCTILSGKVAQELLYPSLPSLCSPEPAILVWWEAAGKP